MDGFPGLQEYLLSQVVRQIGMIAQAVHEVSDTVLVPLDNLRKSRYITRTGEGNNNGFGSLA